MRTCSVQVINWNIIYSCSLHKLETEFYHVHMVMLNVHPPVLMSLYLDSATLPLFSPGEFPVMSPGKVHEYASCTTFSTTSEYMEGHYTFHRLKNKEEVFDVRIPRFHMVCPTFRESVVRSVSASSPVLLLSYLAPTPIQLCAQTFRQYIIY